MKHAIVVIDDDGIVIPLVEIERRVIETVVEHCGGNRAVAARVLGIARSTLYRKLPPLPRGAAPTAEDSQERGLRA